MTSVSSLSKVQTKMNLLSFDVQVEEVDNLAADAQFVRQFERADVLVVLFRLPRREPVVLEHAPQARVDVTQIDAGAHERAVHLRQVRHVGAVLRDFLSRENQNRTCIFQQKSPVIVIMIQCDAVMLSH